MSTVHICWVIFRVLLAISSCECIMLSWMSKATHCPGQVLSADHRYDTFAARDMLECAAVCRRAYNECISVVFDVDRRLCHLGNATAEKECSNMEAAVGKMKYYEMMKCENGGVLSADGKICSCPNGYFGETCNITVPGCDGYRNSKPAVLWIKPALSPSPFLVSCQFMVKRGMSKTVILKRRSISMNFNRTINQYRRGFGKTSSNNYWLGLEKIHQITSTRAYNLKVFINQKKVNQTFQFIYKNFVVGDKASGYALSLAGGKSDGCFWDSRGAKFSAPNADKDGSANVHCASLHHAGWWFKGNSCSSCNPLGTIIFPYNGSRKGVDGEAFWNDTLGDLVPFQLTFNLLSMP